MKSINKYISLIAILVLGACDPLEDEVKVVSEANKVVSSDFEYTLTDDDYETIDEVCSCTGFGNFGSEDDAKTNIPVALNSVFPALGSGSFGLITYELFNGSSPDLRGDFQAHTVSDQEYQDLGFTFGNFSNLEADLPVYANFKWPDAGDGDYMDVTHDYWAPGFVPDVLSRVGYTVAYGWRYVNILDDDAYGDFFNESGIDFSSSGEGQDKMPTYLNETIKFSSEGDIMLWQYNHDDDNEGPTPALALYIYDGTEWLLYNDHYQITQEVLSFAHDGNVWVPDNTIKYTLSTGDYGTVAAEYAGTARGDNLATFGNFNRTGGSTSWSDEQMIEALNFLLKDAFPGMEQGQKFLLTVVIYNGATTTEEWNLILSGEDYILNAE